MGRVATGVVAKGDALAGVLLREGPFGGFGQLDARGRRGFGEAAEQRLLPGLAFAHHLLGALSTSGSCSISVARLLPSASSAPALTSASSVRRFNCDD